MNKETLAAFGGMLQNSFLAEGRLLKPRRARSRQGLMHIRTMTVRDIPAGMRLKEIAGWNQTEADWQIFLDASREGCFVAEVDGVVGGTATTIVYGGRLAWVGMVLVHPQYRGHGMGTMLLKKCIEHLDSIQVPCIKLDATPLGKPIYEKLGFATEYGLERWTLKRRKEDLARRDQLDPDESMPGPVLEDVLKADREVFGADRGAVLRALNLNQPLFTHLVRNAGGTEGYAFGRRGSFADHVGPWIAKDEAAGEGILMRFLAHSRREMVVTDCSKANRFARKLLQARGFEYSRPLTRMFRGRNEYPGRPELVCAVLGPEFG
ncbi:MAG TPA: GNAT family N-acetyltransferase [Candidatus Acidoferrum sp.]|jgi:GNAT superfamily N-acetyltransferase|nr:GNAT family N-acetyltransferase [Candidatus Acidoferrum sp.]